MGNSHQFHHLRSPRRTQTTSEAGCDSWLVCRSSRPATDEAPLPSGKPSSLFRPPGPPPPRHAAKPQSPLSLRRRPLASSRRLVVGSAAARLRTVHGGNAGDGVRCESSARNHQDARRRRGRPLAAGCQDSEHTRPLAGCTGCEPQRGAARGANRRSAMALVLPGVLGSHRLASSVSFVSRAPIDRSIGRSINRR